MARHFEDASWVCDLAILTDVCGHFKGIHSKLKGKCQLVSEMYSNVSAFRIHYHYFIQSVQRWATGWMIGVLGFDSRWGLGIFLFTTVSRMALGHTQPPMQWVPGALSLGVKRPGREADHSPPSSAEVK
jgi:hypothetical protein